MDKERRRQALQNYLIYLQQDIEREIKGKEGRFYCISFVQGCIQITKWVESEYPWSTAGVPIDRENYFWHARQNVRQAFSTLSDILSPCQTFSPVDDWCTSVVILMFLVGHSMCIEPCRTKCTARSELSAGHQHDMSSIFRDHWGASYMPLFQRLL